MTLFGQRVFPILTIFFRSSSYDLATKLPRRTFPSLMISHFKGRRSCFCIRMLFSNDSFLCFKCVFKESDCIPKPSVFLVGESKLKIHTQRIGMLMAQYPLCFV